jgi:uncharacterized protein (DUF1697 family)
MVYVALLRGINVGGNRKVEMAKLKLTFEALGFENIKTFIASGNVVFRTSEADKVVLVKTIETAIEKDFGFHVDVLLRDLPTIEKLVKELPNDWAETKQTRCYAMFLWDEVDSPKVLGQLPHNPGIEDMRYFPGVVVWYIERTNITKSRVLKIIGTPFYKRLTMRNVNTVRKLYELMLAADN